MNSNVKCLRHAICRSLVEKRGLRTNGIAIQTYAVLIYPFAYLEAMVVELVPDFYSASSGLHPSSFALLPTTFLEAYQTHTAMPF